MRIFVAIVDNQVIGASNLESAALEAIKAFNPGLLPDEYQIVQAELAIISSLESK